MKKSKILFIDLDGTLINTISQKTFPQGIWDMKFNLDVWKKIKQLEPEYVFIITNQGGIGKFINENEFERKLDYIEVALKSYIKHPLLKEVQSMYCDSNDKDDPYRKPNIGMIEYFIKTYRLNEKYSIEDILMVGDSSGKDGDSSDTDLKTAENANIKYLDINDFLKATFF